MKYYLCALLICGAFFSYSQDVQLPNYHCPDGNAVVEYEGNQICTTGVGYGIQYRVQGQSVTSAPAKDVPTAAADWASKKSGTTDNGCPITNTYTYVSHDQYGGVTFRHDQVYFTGANCQVRSTYTATTGATYGQLPPTYYCPPDDAPSTGYVNLGGSGASQFCWKFAEELPPDEPPPQCDDIVGNCEPDPQCVQGGGGMMVCKADPDEKCSIDEFGQTQCDEGCGFVNDAFFCATEPTDNPDFAKCKFTFNGYACPSEPQDDITEPQKPADQMTKQDHKDINIGVESRLNLTNDLIETQLAADERNAGEITGAINNMNQNLGGKLNTINGTLGGIGEGIEAINDSLNPEETREIGQPESWYEPVYEDGISGVWDSHRAALDQTPLFTFLDQFSFAPSGTQPDWNMCFNLGALGNYGCERLEVPAFIWNFIRIVMLLGAAFTARRLVFGG